MVNVEEERMQEGISQLSERGLVRREEELVGREEQVKKDANQEEHGQEVMEEHVQQKKSQSQLLQEEPPASTSPAPWPPSLPAECEGKQGWEDKDLGHRGLTVGKVPDVGLVEEHTQPRQQQRRQEEPLASTSPAPWPPPLPGLTVGKVPDVGLMEGHPQPQ